MKQHARAQQPPGYRDSASVRTGSGAHGTATIADCRPSTSHQRSLQMRMDAAVSNGTTGLQPVPPQGGTGLQQIAQRGFSGRPSTLPHLSRIQRAFGAYDVSDVRAYIGGPAKTANAALNAVGYTSGDAIAFARYPDLRLAAHEATHAVQQRAGVQLQDALGRSGDKYERHADAVADAVVQGQSAEGLLSVMAPPRVAAPRRPVGSRPVGVGHPIQRKLPDVGPQPEPEGYKAMDMFYGFSEPRKVTTDRILSDVENPDVINIDTYNTIVGVNHWMNWRNNRPEGIFVIRRALKRVKRHVDPSKRALPHTYHAARARNEVATTPEARSVDRAVDGWVAVIQPGLQVTADQLKDDPRMIAWILMLAENENEIGLYDLASSNPIFSGRLFRDQPWRSFRRTEALDDRRLSLNFGHSPGHDNTPDHLALRQVISWFLRPESKSDYLRHRGNIKDQKMAEARRTVTKNMLPFHRNEGFDLLAWISSEFFRRTSVLSIEFVLDVLGGRVFFNLAGRSEDGYVANRVLDIRDDYPEGGSGGAGAHHRRPITLDEFIRLEELTDADEDGSRYAGRVFLYNEFKPEEGT